MKPRHSISETLLNYGADLPDIPDEDTWVSVPCPFHEDTHSSASLNEGAGLFKCHGCGVQGDAIRVTMHANNCNKEDAIEVLEDAKITVKPVLMPSSVHRVRGDKGLLTEAAERYADNLDDAGEYLKSRGITRTAAKGAGLGVVGLPVPGHEQFVGRLSIPYHTTSGVVAMKFRCMSSHKCKDHGHAKYLTAHGETRMYHALSALTHHSYIAVTEGELDALVLNYLCGVPAVGVPGANNWKGHYARVLDGFDRIYVLGDGDEAGGKFARDVSKKLDNALPIIMPDEHDVNSLYLEGGKDAVLSLLGVKP